MNKFLDDKIKQFKQKMRKKMPYMKKKTRIAKKVQNHWDISNIKNSRNIVVFFNPQHLVMCGGIMSVFSLCKATRKVLPDYETVIATAPGKYTYCRNTFFRNKERIYRWEQIIDNLTNKDNVIFHICEFTLEPFWNALSYSDKKKLKSLKNLQINIENQRDDIMSDIKWVNKFKKLTKNITMTCGHPNYCTQEQANKYNMPCHLFHVNLDLSGYKSVSWDEKEKIILLDCDLSNKYRDDMIRTLKKGLPDYKFILVKFMTFTRYMYLVSKSMFSISFAEGFDGWLIHPLYVGSLGLSIYNEEYFPNSSWLDEKNIYSSLDDFLENAVDDIKYFENHKDEYYEMVDRQLKMVGGVYSYDSYIDNIDRFYKKQYDYLPLGDNK